MTATQSSSLCSGILKGNFKEKNVIVYIYIFFYTKFNRGTYKQYNNDSIPESLSEIQRFSHTQIVRIYKLFWNSSVNINDIILY